MDPIDIALGESVRDAITEAGLTQKFVYSEIGMASTTWERAVAGKGSFKAPELIRLAKVIHTKASRLVAMAEERLK